MPIQSNNSPHVVVTIVDAAGLKLKPQLLVLSKVAIGRPVAARQLRI